MPELSKRSTWSSLPQSEYIERYVETFSDLYSAENPNGYISLAIAQNNISSPLVASALARLPPLSKHHLTYTAASGDPACAAVLADFMSRYITKQPVDPKHLVFSCGGGGGLDMLAFALCDPGDKVMITGPGYRGFERAAMWRAGVKAVVAQLEEQDGFAVTVEALEKTWQMAGGVSSRIRYLVVCSPGNPTGEVLDRSTLLDIVVWARSRKLHTVFDEVYALSVHGNTEFCSVANAVENELGEDVHILWSFSKDFCASGLRFGVVLSHSKMLRECISRISLFSDVSRQTQWAIQNLLGSDLFVRSFLAVNRVRLAGAYKEITGLLEADKIPYLNAQAGFFVWVNLSKWMRGVPSRDAEMDLWRRIVDCKVILSPGCECFSGTYGWFRVCFAAVPRNELVLAWNRIRKHVLM